VVDAFMLTLLHPGCAASCLESLLNFDKGRSILVPSLFFYVRICD
jgi:hypothetical protein